MELEDLSNEAASYFEIHPNAAIWNGKNANAQQGALKLALADLRCFFGGAAPDLADLAVRTAVFEQALYLLFTSDNYRRQTAGETIDGVGSVTYAADSGQPDARHGLCPRAMRFAESVLARSGINIRRG